MQFSTLFLISLFSVSLVLSGCVGSDNDTGTSNSGQSQENGDGSTPEDNKDEESSDNTEDDNNNDQTPTIPGMPTPPDNDNENSKPTPEDLVCDDPITSTNDSSLGDVGQSDKYNIGNYTAVTEATSLEGTWVVVGEILSKGNSLNNPSTLVKQKSFFVIKKDDTTNQYQVANCSGSVVTKDIRKEKVCVDPAGAQIDCKDGDNTVSVGIEYLAWDGYLDRNIDTETNSITLPVSLAAELEFYIETNSYLTNTSKRYYAKKISTDTSELGTLSLENSKQNKTSKRVYYKALTAEEIDVYKTGTGYKDIDKLTKENINSYGSIELPSETTTSLKYTSTYNNKQLSCLSQQVLYTRQCRAKDSEETTETNTLAAVSATSKSSYHLLFATEKDTDTNLLTVQNLTVKSGKTTDDNSVGSRLTRYNNINFDAADTQNAKDMDLDITAEIKNEDSHSYQTGFKAMCSPTKTNFLSSSGGDCDEEDKTIYKTLLETTNTIVERKADVNLEPDPARVK